MPTTYNPKYNTYIGARYVPLVDGQWDNTKQYEPLTIVLYQGASYTSKTYVPVGVDILNETYWALTGDYNAQIGSIQEQVNKNTSDINTLETNMSGFNGDITRISGEIEGLDTRVTALEDETGTGGIVSLRGVKSVLMGDSLNVGDGWGKYTKDFTGLDCKIYGNGSSGFVSKGNTAPFTGMNFEEMLDYLQTNVTASEREKVQLFVLLGGINDVINNLSGVPSAVTSFMTKLKVVYPNAKYIVAPLHTFKRISPAQFDMYNQIYSTASHNGAYSTIDFIWLCYGWPAWGQSDQVHLTNAGYQALAENITAFLGGGSVNDNHPLPIVHVTDNRITNNNISAFINKNTVTINGTAVFTPTTTAKPTRIVFATCDYGTIPSAPNRDAWQYTFAYLNEIKARCWCTFNSNGINLSNWDASLDANQAYTCYFNVTYLTGLTA